MKNQTKKKMNAIICEVAWNIEQRLTGEKADFLLAELAGVKPADVSDVALKCAIREVKDALNFRSKGKPGREWIYGIIAKHLSECKEIYDKLQANN